MNKLPIAHQKIQETRKELETIYYVDISTTYSDLNGEIKIIILNTKTKLSAWTYIFEDNIKDIKDEKDMEIYVYNKVLYTMAHLFNTENCEEGESK